MHRLFRLAAGMVVACAVADVHAAAGPNGPALANATPLQTAPPEAAPQTMVQRFLARGEEPPVEYRALRRLEADNPKFKQSAWMVAWTEYDHANGLKYEVVAEGGSGYIRSKVLRAALEGEQKIWANHEPQKASFTAENYLFEAGPDAPDGLASITG